MWACEMANVPKPQIKQTNNDFITNYKLQCTIYMFWNLDLERGIKNPLHYYNILKNQSCKFLNKNFPSLERLSFLPVNFETSFNFKL